MPYARRFIGFQPSDRSRVVGVVHDELVAARARYPDDSTPQGHSISTSLLEGYNAWVAQGSDLATTDEAGYAKWTQQGAVLVNALRDIEGFAKEGSFSWVVKETIKQSAADTAKLLEKVGKRTMSLGSFLFSWKGAALAGGVGIGFLVYYSERRKTLEAKMGARMRSRKGGGE